MTPTGRPLDGEPALLPPDGKATVLFASCRLQVAARKLFVDGRPVELGNRAFDLLLALVESRGQMLDKRRIMDRVWPDLPMDEANLRVQMHAIRKALGQDRHLIKTVQGRGYRFAAAVTVLAGDAAAPARPAVAPAEIAAPGAGTNLPLPIGPLIGRAAELDEVGDLLGRKRLVTLVGTGGIGKTRLAVELGRRSVDRFPDGVWLVDLAPVADAGQVASTAAAALGVALGDAEVPADALAAALERQRLLLILDNCEHLVGAAAGLVAALLGRAPGLAVLATSQESLQVPGEQIYRLPPLGLPAADGPAALDAVADSGAVALFVERARESDPRFRLDPANARGVAEICRRLDGLPLALEMAAARLPLLGLDGLGAALDDRLSVLKRSPRAGAARHMTLGAMIEWSHGLLDAAERRVFRRLAVFVGSFSLDAAVAVAGDDDTRWEVLEILGRLVDKSLVAVEEGEPPRYRLLETLRCFGLEQLAAAGEADAVALRHARHFAELFDQAHERWETTADAAWVELYRGELGNVRAMLDWALADPAHGKLAATVAGPFAIVWYNLGLVAEGRRYADRILAVLGRDPSPAAARFLRFACYLWDSTDRRRMAALLDQSAAVYRQLNDQTDLAPVLAAMSRLHMAQQQPDAAAAALAEAQRLLPPADRKKSQLSVVSARATFAYYQGDGTEEQRQLDRALELAQGLGDSVRIANILTNMAECAFVAGALPRAIARARDALAVMQSTGRQAHRAWARINLASYLTARGDLAEARVLAAEALAEARDSGGHIVRVCLQQWALIGALEGRVEDAARLAGFVDQGFAATGEVREPTERLVRAALGRALDARLPERRLGDCAAEGAQWSEQQAVGFAMSRLVARPAEAPGPPLPA